MKYPTLIKLSSPKEVDIVLRYFEQFRLGELKKIVDPTSFVYEFKNKNAMEKGYEILKELFLKPKK